MIFHYYRPKRSFGQGNIFTPVCHSVHGGVLLARPPPRHREPPPRADNPPGWRTPPGWTTPPGWRTPPEQNPPRMENQPPPGKQTPAYGLRSAGTHPTGMHSCIQIRLPIFGCKFHHSVKNSSIHLMTTIGIHFTFLRFNFGKYHSVWLPFLCKILIEQ